MWVGKQGGEAGQQEYDPVQGGRLRHLGSCSC
jgi:hypothetical protein